jgi:hypothetical protein
MSGERDPGRDIVITANDARVSGFCGAGMSNWGKHRGMTVKKMLAGEYTVGAVEDLNDALGNRIARAARDRVAREGE